MTERPALLVKPLVWGPSGFARTQIGVMYRLDCENAHVWRLVTYVTDFDGPGHTTETAGTFEREALAKAAADEDHRQRVLSSFDMTTYERLIDKLLDSQATLPNIQQAVQNIVDRDRRLRRDLKALRRYVVEMTPRPHEAEILARLDIIIAELNSTKKERNSRDRH